MKQTKLQKRLHEIRGILDSEPSRALQELDALASETIPLQGAEQILKSVAVVTALVAYAAGDYEKTIAAASTYLNLETDADNDDYRLALFTRGKAHFKSGDLEKCILDLNTALELHDTTEIPYLAELQRYRGTAFLRLENFDEAIEAFEHLCEIDDLEDDETLSALGTAYLHAEKYQDAIRIFTDATERTPDSPDVWYKHGTALLKYGAYEDAESAFTAAIHLKSDEPAYYKSRAIVRKQLGKKNSAADDWLLMRFLDANTT